MNVRKSLAATCLLAVLLAPRSAQAMEIRQFDKMSDQDQADYIGDLIVGAEKALTGEGKPDLGSQVRHLFTTKEPGDADTIGAVEFEIMLARVRLVDAKNADKNPNAPRLEVEHVMILILKSNDIELPKSFMTVMKDFKPKFPPRTK